MVTRKIIRKVHLWLGLGSGLIIVFLGISGCILVFELEIRSILESFQYVEIKEAEYLPPSILTKLAEPYFDGKKASAIEYRPVGKSARISFYNEKEYKIVSL